MVACCKLVKYVVNNASLARMQSLSYVLFPLKNRRANYELVKRWSKLRVTYYKENLVLIQLN